MGFQGIDPDGLDELSARTAIATAEVMNAAVPTRHILGRHGYGDDAASVQTMSNRMVTWGADAAAALHWRADLIRTGQNSPGDASAVLRAEFAVEGVFTDSEADAAFSAWQRGKERIGQAVAAITDWLDQGITDWDVSNDDLHNIRNTLTELSGEELDEVIEALSPRQLERWIDEMGNSFNGFSRDEKQELFAALAGNANGESLGKIHDALLGAGSGQDAIDFGQAIRYQAADNEIAAFVGYVMDTDLAARRYSTLAPALAVSGIEDTDAVDGAIRAITDTEGALEIAIVDSLVTAHIEDTGSSCIDIDPLGSLVTAISRGTDPAVTATAFAVIAGSAFDLDGTLRRLLARRYDIADAEPDGFGSGDSDEATRLLGRSGALLLDEATQLLVSDADGVIGELATDVDPDGLLTTTFLYELIDHDRHDSLGRITHALRGGSEVDVFRFAEEGHDPGYRFPHAQNLAYLAGTLTNALERYADDAKRDIAVIGLAGSAAITGLGAAFGAVPTWLGVSTDVVDTGSNFILGGSTVNNIDDWLEALTRKVEVSLQPSVDIDISVENGGLAYRRWLARFRDIVGAGSP